MVAVYFHIGYIDGTDSESWYEAEKLEKVVEALCYRLTLANAPEWRSVTVERTDLEVDLSERL